MLRCTASYGRLSALCAPGPLGQRRPPTALVRRPARLPGPPLSSHLPAGSRASAARASRPSTRPCRGN
eukprot:1475295-Lingulodinium_polyedra.AAC.1